MANQQVAYCETCRQSVEFETRTRQAQGERDGKSYRYRKQVALCPICGEEIDFSPYRRAAERAFEKACASDAGLITPEQIRELPRKYAIGKRPLSKLLGWGELTYTRLLDGNIPTPEHSAELLELLDDPTAFAQLLQRGYERGVITETALRRSMRAIRDMVGNQADVAKKASAVADRLCILAEGDLTPSALQSLLYYAHGYSMVLLDAPLFDTQPLATTQGPEYQHIRKGYSFDNIQATYQHALDRARAVQADAPRVINAASIGGPLPNSPKDASAAYVDAELGNTASAPAEAERQPTETIEADSHAHPVTQSASISQEDVDVLYAKAENAREKKGKKSKKYKKALKAAMEAEALFRAQSALLESEHAEEEPPSIQAEPEPGPAAALGGAFDEERVSDLGVPDSYPATEPAYEPGRPAPTDILAALTSPLSGAEAAVVDRVYARYGAFSGQALAARIRSESPWRAARESGEAEGDQAISREGMLAYFATLEDLAS